MPPSWLRLPLGKIPAELESANWSGSLAHPVEANLSSGGAAFGDALLAQIALPADVTAMAYEPVQSFLALGTAAGTLHLYGRPGVRVEWALRPAYSVKHLAFRSGTGILVVADAKDNLHIFDISRTDPSLANGKGIGGAGSGTGPSSGSCSLHPDTPMRIGAHSARNSITCIEVQPGHAHLFCGLRDGTVDAYDLDRLSLSPYRVPNLWWEEEEILRKSGVPDAPSRRHVPLIIDIASHPLDMGKLLLAYEGGACLLDIKTRSVLKTFQLRLLPGAPGAGGVPEQLLWTERASPATCVAFRPDACVIAMGHADGLVSFWNIEDEDKPLMVRTLSEIDVDKPQASLDEAPRQFMREPIFKLAWSGFPASSWRDYAAGAMSDGTTYKGTLLTVLGGAIVDAEPPGIVSWQLPDFSAPVQLWGGKTPEATTKLRNALRASLEPTRETRINTDGVCEDFLLLPKASPHYGNVYDPQAVLTLIGADPRLPPVAGSARGLQAFAYPPLVLADLSSQPRPMGATAPKAVAAPPRVLHLPLPLSFAGSSAVLGGKLIVVSPHSYRKLAGPNMLGAREKTAMAEELAEAASASDGADLPLRGGQAHPPSGDRSTTLSLGEHRILVTWHNDGTVRFADASPHLLLIGKQQEVPADKAGDPDAVPPLPVLERAFPAPLPHLTINVLDLTLCSNDGGAFTRLRANVSRLAIFDAELASDSLELGVVLAGGALLHFRFDFARASQTEALRSEVEREVEQTEQFVRQHVGEEMGSGTLSPMRESSALDDAMSSAIRDLGVAQEAQHPSTMTRSGSLTGAPPPRPRRDPKRLSMQPQARAPVTPTLDSAPGRTWPISAPGSSNAGRLNQEQSRAMIREIEPIGHLADWATDGFKPNLLIDISRGGVSALALSDCGFVALACGSALAVVDLRVPAIIYREGFGDGSDTPVPDTREARKMAEDRGEGPVVRLKIAIARTMDDYLLSPRLIALRSGRISVKTFTSMHHGWICAETSMAKVDELVTPVALAVLNWKGDEVTSLPTELRRSLREHERPDDEDPARSEPYLLLAAAEQHLVIRVGLTGPKLAKVDVGEKVLAMQVIERYAERVCAVITPTSTRIFSLPHLELVSRIHSRHRREATPTSFAPLSLSLTRCGDVFEAVSSTDARLWTLIPSAPHAAPTQLDLYSPKMKAACPSHPGTVQAAAAAVKGIGGWLTGSTTGAVLDAGAQLDEAIAGAKRPPMPRLPVPKYIQQQAARDEAAAEREAAREATELRGKGRARPAAPPPRPTEAQRIARETDDTHGIASANLAAVQERGDLMNNLGESLGNLERGASKWLQDSKQMAMKAQAKATFSRAFGM